MKLNIMRHNLKIWKPELSNISDAAIIGDDCIIHSHVVIYDGVEIGDRVKIQSGVFIPNWVEIGNDVFIGPHAVFLNDKYPPSNGVGWTKTKVQDGVSIGGNVTVLPGITIHQGAMIGAGSVVTRNVPEGEVWCGNPARYLKDVTDL